MKAPASPTFARWLPALAVWSAVLLSLILAGDDTAQPILAGGPAAPCTPVLASGSAG